ncbi:MAG: PmoA family protein [Bacteroidales bacterium]|nr:PmoA family protein [Bacteroidales bacterium]
MKELNSHGIKFIHDTAYRRIDILINDNIFTAFLYADSFEKPFFFPVYAPCGTAITRGYPMDPEQGERIDHPHHTGMWFNYGNVNNIDFWNNSRDIPEKKKANVGKIVCIKDSLKTSEADGSLRICCNWINPVGQVLLYETTVFFFRMEHPGLFSMKRVTTLNAIADTVVLGDSKEGLLAIRVGRSFEVPSGKPAVLYDTLKGTGTDARIDTTGVNGRYRGSNGLCGEDVWGTRNSWVTLSAVCGDDSISIGIMDHPGNYGFPSYWHARGYGLFSVNNFGVQSYDAQQPVNQMVLLHDESLTLQHLVLVKSGGFLTDSEMEGFFGSFGNPL